jgi:hypothetical protein
MSAAAGTFISAPAMLLLFATNSQVILIVSGLLVELVPLVLNVGFVIDTNLWQACLTVFAKSFAASTFIFSVRCSRHPRRVRVR